MKMVSRNLQSVTKSNVKQLFGGTMYMINYKEQLTLNDAYLKVL